MFLLSFLSNKAVLIGLSLIVIGSVTAYGGIKVNDYRQTQIIVQEAKQLSSEGKYHEAISKLTTTGNKWSPKETKEEIKREIEDNKLLDESSKNYELGKELFDKGSYKDALEVLSKVDNRNINYTTSRSLIELAETKIIEIPKGEVAGVKSEVITTKTVPKVLPSPTMTPTPIIPSSTPEPQPAQHTDSYCKNEAKLAVIKYQDRINEVNHQQSPWLFSYDAYLKQYPGSDIGIDAWQQLAKSTLAGYEQYAVKEAEKIYLQVYNYCLSK